jgi:DNA polymerase III epsilon subunit-like protein
MKGITTLVYFDIEATGLKSSGRPRITEISCVAVNMDSILRLSLEIKKILKNPNLEGYAVCIPNGNHCASCFRHHWPGQLYAEWPIKI